MQKLLSIFKFNILFKYGIALLLLAIPLYPKFPLANIPGTYVAIRIEDLLISLLAIVYFLYCIKYEKTNFFKSKLNIAVFLFFAGGLLSLLSGILITKTVTSHIGLLHWARRIEYFIPFLAAVTAIKLAKPTRFFYHLLFVVAILTVVYGFGQMHFNFPVISTQNEEYSKGIALRWIPGARLHSTFTGHYDLAAYLVMFFPLGVAYFLSIRNKLQQALGFFLIIAPSFWLFLQTEARVSFVAYLAGVGLTLWLLGRKRLIVPVLVLSIAGMLIFSSLGSRYLRTIDAYKNRLMTQVEVVKSAHAYEDNRIINQTEQAAPLSEDRSFSIRLNVEWPRAIRAFLKNPILGTGYSSIGLATDNDYLRLLGEVGLLGFLAFATVILRVLEGARNFLKTTQNNLERAFIAGFLGSMFGFLLNALFIDVFEASKVAIIFWTLAGITVGIAATGRQDVKKA